MKRFVFSLEALLKKRRQEEDAIKRQLADTNAKIVRLRQTIGEIHQRLADAQQTELQRRKHSPEVLSMRYSVIYRNNLKMELLTQGNYLNDAYQEQSRIQQNLARAMQRTKAVELLKEQRFGQWRKEYERSQRLFIDDISQQRYIRRQAQVHSETERETGDQPS
ncbi:MAG: flagellar FliJ family protein [Chitinivibrionales bacterium]|nr:flagellar FliJ family protein [Chitinivibrionales bacterium]